jgi:hypothetical protein
MKQAQAARLEVSCRPVGTPVTGAVLEIVAA